MNKFKEFEITCHKGYLGDFTTEWWTEDDWDKHREYVRKLEESDEYGKEFKVNVKIQHDPLYDKSIKHSKSTESYRMTFLDLLKI